MVLSIVLHKRPTVGGAVVVSDNITRYFYACFLNVCLMAASCHEKTAFGKKFKFNVNFIGTLFTLFAIELVDHTEYCHGE